MEKPTGPAKSNPINTMGKDELELFVSSKIEEFASLCLSSNVDILVPIGGEGLGLLIPAIKAFRQANKSFPHIIPSSALDSIDPALLKNKTALVVDGTIYTGSALRETLVKLLPFGQPKVAALLVSEGFEGYENLKGYELLNSFLVNEPIFLTANRFSWARSRLIEFLREEVFVRPGDPPMWEVRFETPDDKLSFVHFVLGLPASYKVKFENPKGENRPRWSRINADGIKLTDDTWLSPDFQFSETHKIRILVSSQEECVRLLPLFRVRVPSSTKETPETVVKRAKSCFPGHYDLVFAHSREADQTLDQTYRWTATIGSLLLLIDFLRLFRQLNSDVKLENLNLISPVPNIYSYSCRDTVLNSLEKVVYSAIKPEASLKAKQQLPLVPSHFSFIGQEKENEGVQVAARPALFKSPEDELARIIGEWIEPFFDEGNEIAMSKLKVGLTSGELADRAKALPSLVISKALDRLVDEGVIKVHLGVGGDGRYGPQFSPAGESVSRSLTFFNLVTSA